MKSLFFTCLVLMSALSWASGEKSVELPYNYQGRLALGTGVDTFNSDKRPVCVRWDSISNADYSNSPFEEIVFNLEQVEDFTSLEKTLELNTSASVRGLCGRVDGKTSSMHRQSFNSYSLYFVISSKVTLPAQELVSYRLTDEALALAQNNSQHFREVCGDEFVQTTTKGGNSMVF